MQQLPYSYLTVCKNYDLEFNSLIIKTHHVILTAKRIVFQPKSFQNSIFASHIFQNFKGLTTQSTNLDTSCSPRKYFPSSLPLGVPEQSKFPTHWCARKTNS